MRITNLIFTLVKSNLKLQNQVPNCILFKIIIKQFSTKFVTEVYVVDIQDWIKTISFI
jgi:hypothetical protein